MTNYQKFNEIRRNLKYLNDFKKPLTKILEKLFYNDGLFKYKDNFEYYFIDKTKEVEVFIENLKKDNLTIDTEIEVTIMKLSALLEIKEDFETEKFKKYLKK